jgi:cytochrome c oxidase subunit IV
MKLFLAILAERIVEAQWSFLIDMLRVAGTVIAAIVIIVLLLRSLS